MKKQEKTDIGNLPENFRIIKLETKSDAGEIETFYKVQEKFLWWFWKEVSFKTCWDGRHGLTLNRTYYRFRTIEEVKEFLDKYYINSSFEYKGNKISRRMGLTSHSGEFFVNENDPHYYYSTTYYNYSKTLEGLKREIDKKIKTTTEIIIK